MVTSQQIMVHGMHGTDGQLGPSFAATFSGGIGRWSYTAIFFLKSSHPGTLQVFFVCGVDHVSISAWKGPGRKFWKSKQDPGYPGYPGLGQMSWIKDMDPLSRWPASTVSPAMEGVRSSDKLCRKNFCCFGCGNRGMSISQY